MAEFASKGSAATGIALGASALGASLLNGGLGGILGGLGNNHSHHYCSENTPTTRVELQYERQLTNKDAEIAYLRGQTETDRKLVETTRYLEGQIKETNAKVDALAKEFYVTSKEQAVFNAEVTGKIAEMSVVVSDNRRRLNAITFEAVNETRICNPCCGCNN